MRNRFLQDRQRAEIDGQISKILRGLGNPEPPLDLAQVRTLLRLDVGYYSSTDDSALREFISRVRVAGKLFIERPTRILDVVRKFDLKALFYRMGRESCSTLPNRKLSGAGMKRTRSFTVLPHHRVDARRRHANLSPSCHVVRSNTKQLRRRTLAVFRIVFEFALGGGRPTFAVVKSAQRSSATLRHRRSGAS